MGSSVGVDCDADLAGKVVSQLDGKTSRLSLLKVWRRLVPCQPVVVVELLPQLLLVVMLQLLLLRKRRKRSPKRNLMTIWDSVSSTKNHPQGLIKTLFLKKKKKKKKKKK